MLMTTLNEIKKHNPCSEGWEAVLKLKSYTVETYENDETPFPVSDIGKLGNIRWVFWTARMFKGGELKPYMLAVINAVKEVKHLMRDERSIKAIEATQNYIDGKITLEELKEAKKAAADAAADAADAAAYAAYAAADAYAAAADAYADAAAYAAADAADYAADAAAYAADADAAAREKTLKYLMRLLDEREVQNG